MEFIKTCKGGRKMLYEGYAYIVDKKKENVTYWRCEKKGFCGGRLKTINDIIEKDASNHSHPPNAARILSMKTIEKIKEVAKNSEEVTSSIIQNCTSNFPLEAAGALPKKETLARMVRRHRTTPNGNILNDDLRKTTRGEDFIMYESENLIILSTKKNVDLLSKKQHWLCDGTFDSAPLGFQLYTIHVLIEDNHTIPLVYCISKNKNQETYNLIFSIIKEKNPDINPISITVDFERAAINCMTNFLQNTIIYGCFFHFSQCLWRKIQSLGLKIWYNNEKNALIIKCLEALAFVPVEDVVETFNDFVKSIEKQNSNILSEFLNYFEKTWIGELQQGTRRKPTFDITMWNTFERTKLGLPRTNNSLEGWHRAFDQRMSITHPSICRLVSKIRKEQAEWELTIEKIDSGVELRKPKKKYEIINNRIMKVLEKYSEYSRLDFLKAIAHNI